MAATDTAKRNRGPVADDLAAAVAEDQWAAAEAGSVPLAVADAGAPDAATVCGDGTKDFSLAGGDGIDGVGWSLTLTFSAR